MIHHRAAVMGDEDAAFEGRDLENNGIDNSFQFAVCGGGEVDGGLSTPDASNDPLPDVGVRLEANAQARDLPISARARWSLSQSAGFSSASGMVLASNSRLVSSRYLSISAWWSR